MKPSAWWRTGGRNIRRGLAEDVGGVQLLLPGETAADIEIGGDDLADYGDPDRDRAPTDVGGLDFVVVTPPDGIDLRGTDSADVATGDPRDLADVGGLAFRDVTDDDPPPPGELTLTGRDYAEAADAARDSQPTDTGGLTIRDVTDDDPPPPGELRLTGRVHAEASDAVRDSQPTDVGGLDMRALEPSIPEIDLWGTVAADNPHDPRPLADVGGLDMRVRSTLAEIQLSGEADAESPHEPRPLADVGGLDLRDARPPLYPIRLGGAAEAGHPHDPRDLVDVGSLSVREVKPAALAIALAGDVSADHVTPTPRALRDTGTLRLRDVTPPPPPDDGDPPSGGDERS